MKTNLVRPLEENVTLRGGNSLTLGGLDLESLVGEIEL